MVEHHLGGHFVINLPARRVLFNDIEMKLTDTEFRLMWLLINNNGVSMTYEKLITHIWGDEKLADIKCLQVHIKNLRDKMELVNLQDFCIRNIRGIGYRLEIK